MNDYRSVNCDFYDKLELLAMHRQRCVVAYLLADGCTQSINVVIVDVFAREGAEYMLLSSGETIRLDSLVSVDGVTPAASES